MEKSANRESEIRHIEILLVRQEHRLFKLVSNWLRFRKNESGDDFRVAATRALFLNLIFSPTSIAIGAGTATLLLLVWQNILLQENNRLIASTLNLGGDVSAQITMTGTDSGYLDGVEILVENTSDKPIYLIQAVALDTEDDRLIKLFELAGTPNRLILPNEASIYPFSLSGEKATKAITKITITGQSGGNRLACQLKLTDRESKFRPIHESSK